MNPNQQPSGTPVSGGFDQAMQADQTAPTQTPPPVAPQHTGNWFTHLLPTIGGIGGSILGGIATAGLGGEFAGGAGGSALGKALENALEGKKVIDGSDLTAGVEGGVGALTGGILGKALGRGAEMLGSRAGNLTKAAADTAEQKAAQDAEVAAAQATRNNFGGAGVSSMRASNNLAGNQKLLQDWGLDHTSPEVMQNASKGGLFIDNIDQNALAAGKPIKTTDLIASKDITKLTPEEESALMSEKVGVITPEGSMSHTVTPQQAHAFGQELNGQMRQLQKLSDNALANGNVADYKQAQAELKQLTNKYNAVQQLAGTPEVNAAVAARMVSPEEKAQLVEQFGQKQADHIEQAINNAQTHSDLVKAKVPFAQMNDISKAALKDLQDSASARGLARAKTDINGDGVSDATAPIQPSPLDIAHDVVNNTHGKGVLGTAISLGAKASNSPTILSTLSRIGGLGAKIAPAAGVAVATSPNLAADPIGLSQSNNGTMGANMQPQENDLANYIHAMELQSALGTSFGGPATSLMAGIAPMLQQNQLLHAQLSGMPGLYANAGGAQGLGGILSHISGLIPGTAAHTYEAQQADIAKKLGINPSVLPSLMQNGDTSGLSQNILGQLQGQLVY